MTFFGLLYFSRYVSGFFFERRVLLLKNESLVLSIFCLIFLIANTANMTLRLIIVFYPFIFYCTFGLKRWLQLGRILKLQLSMVVSFIVF